MCNSETEDIQKDIDLYIQFCDLMSAKSHPCTTSNYRKIPENASPSPLSGKTYEKGKAILNNLLNDIGFDRHPCTLHEKILIKRILYLFSIIDKTAFMKDNSNPNGFFNINTFKVPAIFFPLFTGIIGSLSKNSKKDVAWKAFKESVIGISGDFYKGNVQEFFPIEVPASIDTNALYQYCLDYLLPDDLYNYSTKLEKTMIKANKLFPIERLNLTELENKLYDPDAIFITHHYCKEFYSDLSKALNSFNDYLDKISSPKTVNAVFNPALFFRNSGNKDYIHNLIQNYEETVNKWKNPEEILTLKKLGFTILPSGN